MTAVTATDTPVMVHANVPVTTTSISTMQTCTCTCTCAKCASTTIPLRNFYAQLIAPRSRDKEPQKQTARHRVAERGESLTAEESIG